MNRLDKYQKLLAECQLNAVECRTIRERLSMSQELMAKCHGVGIGMIQRWESRGTRRPSVAVRYREISELTDYLLARRAKPNWKL